jgi:hypothetical protein
MGINANQLAEYVIRPALFHIGLHSEAAENLVLGTALVESHGEYIKQLGKGPALGLFQMEPATANDIWDNYLSYSSRSQLRQDVESLMTRTVHDDAYEIIGNLYYAAAMCRIHYRRVPRPLPAVDDYEGMARYWKIWYNTPEGAGTIEKAIPHFRVACNGD